MSDVADPNKTRATSRPIPTGDPLLAALEGAPIGPPLTEDERHAVEQARELGRWVSGADVRAALDRRHDAGK